MAGRRLSSEAGDGWRDRSPARWSRITRVTSLSAIGQSVPRLDGREKATGATRYAGDLRLPGMLHARLVLSPHAHARIVRIDGSTAAAQPGVVGVFTGHDLPLVKADPTDRGRCPLAIGRVVFVGHPVAAVVAETEAQAEDAAQLVRVEYEALPAAVDPLAAMRPDAPRVREPGAGRASDEALAAHGAVVAGQGVAGPAAPNVASTTEFTRGDVERGLAEATVVIERTYRTSMLHQGYLEPRAAVASVDPLGALLVWTSTQTLFHTRSQVAEAVGLPEHRVRVTATPLGGGFGAKFVLLEPLAAALALATRRPVSIVLSRTEEFLTTTPAPQSVFELRVGAGRDGRLTALDARIIFDAGAYAGAPVGIAALLLGGYYTVPNLRIRGFEVLTHKPGVGAYRAPGAVQATFALESLMDELALRLGIDPLDLRLLNASREGDLLPTGRPWPKIGLVQCLERLRTERQRLSGARQGSPRDGVRRGVGVAVGGWLGGIEPASAVCRLDRDGTLTVVLGMVDMSGAATGMAQIAAEAAGLPLDDVTVVCADTESAPFAGASGGSKITYTVGLAVERAARDARRQILAIAADRLEAAADDLEIVGRSVRVRGMPDRGVTLAQIAKSSMEFGAKYEPVFAHGASATTARSPAFAAHLAEVEVDADTGRVRVVRQVVVQDVGRAINPAGIAAQIHGAVAQGVGWALLEGMSYDAHGQLRSATLMDYALPSITDAPPEVETVILEVPTEHGPFGAKGVGEPPVVAAPAAIANAIADAIGRRLTDLPITSEALARALDAPKPALSSPNR
ncbi:MAG: xanthine dehydrogenase [Candidatus Rokuibacteriota bacterium]|nr:MAG: xanthine dehydrogenase [Candidatus Rokubacteria bacterium]